MPTPLPDERHTDLDPPDATEVALLSRGVLSLAAAEQVQELQEGHGGRLFPFVEKWLRDEAAVDAALAVQAVKPAPVLSNNGWGSGRLTSTRAER